MSKKVRENIPIIKGIKVFDTHSHLNDEQFEGRVDEIIKEASRYNVGHIAVPGYDLESSIKAVEIANSHENIYAIVGIHPDDAENCSKEDLDTIRKLAKENDKVVAIGEIGLDYYWHKEEKNHEKQKELFKKQIEIANELNLPIAIHTREATLDTIEILKENPAKHTGIIHCAPLNEHLIKEALKLGYYISFSGVVTFKNANPNESVRLVPDDKILVETDAPYLTPEPNRGKQNMPGYTYYTLRKVAEIRGEDLEEFSEKVFENSKRVYGIK